MQVEKHDKWIKHINKDCIWYSGLYQGTPSCPAFYKNEWGREFFIDNSLILKRDYLEGREPGYRRMDIHAHNIEAFYYKEEYMRQVIIKGHSDYNENDDVWVTYEVSGKEEYDDICREAVSFAGVDPSVIGKTTTAREKRRNAWLIFDIFILILTFVSCAYITMGG